MLDQFLTAVAETTQKREAFDEMVDLMKQLPAEDLYKIASGEISCAPSGAPTTWLERFQNTPLYDKALQLESQELELDIEDQSRRLAESQKDDMNENSRRDFYRKRNAIDLKKRILDLELTKSRLSPPDAGISTPVAQPDAPPSQQYPTLTAEGEKAASAPFSPSGAALVGSGLGVLSAPALAAHGGLTGEGAANRVGRAVALPVGAVAGGALGGLGGHALGGALGGTTKAKVLGALLGSVVGSGALSGVADKATRSKKAHAEIKKVAELPANVLSAISGAARKAPASLAALSAAAPLEAHHLSPGILEQVAAKASKSINPGTLRVSDLMLSKPGKSINPGVLRVSDFLKGAGVLSGAANAARKGFHTLAGTEGAVHRAASEALTGHGTFASLADAQKHLGKAMAAEKATSAARLGLGAAAGATALGAGAYALGKRRGAKQQAEKTANLAALGGALKGIGGFASGAAKNIGAAGKAGGLKAGLNMAKSVGGEGVRMAGQYAAKNPGTAAALGAGALGGAAMLGRATKD